MNNIKLYVSIGVGGMIGSCVRYAIASFLGLGDRNAFPWETFIVNITGVFILSFIMFLPMIQKKIHPVILSGITTGILGSYTTFSTLSLELVLFMQTNWLQAGIYLISTILGGILFSFFGYKAATLVAIGGNKI